LTYVPPPAELPGFPSAQRARPKTTFAGGLRARWKDADGSILEWDYEHGLIERYDKSGKHLGEFDPADGSQTKKADPARRIEP
jgi:hypothetical protein